MLLSNYTSRVINLMNVACSLALRSTEDNRHGCIVAKKGRILGIGWNKDKTHPAAKHTFTQCIHAEMAAIVSVNKEDLVGADIYVARVKRCKGEPVGISRPCVHCMGLIRTSGIRRVYYTTNNGRVERIKL